MFLCTCELIFCLYGISNNSKNHWATQLIDSKFRKTLCFFHHYKVNMKCHLQPIILAECDIFMWNSLCILYDLWPLMLFRSYHICFFFLRKSYTSSKDTKKHAGLKLNVFFESLWIRVVFYILSVWRQRVNLLTFRSDQHSTSCSLPLIWNPRSHFQSASIRHSRDKPCLLLLLSSLQSSMNRLVCSVWTRQNNNQLAHIIHYYVDAFV